MAKEASFAAMDFISAYSSPTVEYDFVRDEFASASKPFFTLRSRGTNGTPVPASVVSSIERPSVTITDTSCIPAAPDRKSTSTMPSLPGFRFANTASGSGIKSKQAKPLRRTSPKLPPRLRSANVSDIPALSGGGAFQSSPLENFISFVSVSLVVHGLRMSEGRCSMLPMRPGS